MLVEWLLGSDQLEFANCLPSAVLHWGSTSCLKGRLVVDCDGFKFERRDAGRNVGGTKWLEVFAKDDPGISIAV